MADDSQEEVKPAPYPESDRLEHDAVDILDYILSSSVKSHTESRDKDPNHDGWLELVDNEGSSTGRVVVQIKKLPGKHRDTPKKQVRTANLAYCRVCADPFILIAVDIEKEVAHWKHISTKWFEDEELDNQTYKTVHLTGEGTISKCQTDYVSEWQSIVDDTKQRIDNYEYFEKLKEQSNPAIGEMRPKFEAIHLFIDQYNHLLETDFQIMKRMLYPDVWKFGYANIDRGTSSITYALYPINYSENDAQIRDIDSSWDQLRDLGGNIMTTRAGNPLSHSPKQFAYNALDSRVDDLFEKNKLDYSDCIFSASEYVYSFVNEFAPLLGLNKKDVYSVSEIREGYYQHLQFWLSEEMRQILTDHDVGDIHVQLDGYLSGDISPDRGKISKVAKKKTEEADENPPRHQIEMNDFDQGTLERLIDILINSSADEIGRPYQARNREPSESSKIIDFYSYEAIFENLKTYYENYYPEYQRLLKRNFPNLSPCLSENKECFILVSINKDNPRGRGWAVRKFWCHSDEGDMKVEVCWSDDDKFSIGQNCRPRDRLTYKGEEYRITRWESSGASQVVDIDGNRGLVFNDITTKLKKELKSYLRSEKVPSEIAI